MKLNERDIIKMQKEFNKLQYPNSNSLIYSAKKEQEKFNNTEDNKYFKYAVCPLCSEDKFIIFHNRTNYSLKRRKYNKVKWKNSIISLFVKTIGIDNTSKLISLLLGENIDLSNIGYTVVQCTSCGLFYRNPIYREETIMNVYNRGYLKFLKGEYGKDRVKTYDWVLNQLDIKKDILCQNYPDDKRVLDIGCGQGQFLNYIRKFGWNPYGLDFAEDCIAYANKNLGLTNTWTGNLEFDSFKENFFNIVTLWSVAAHLDNPIDMFSKIYRVLKRDGTLVIYTVNAGGLQHMRDLQRWNGFHKNHLIFFTRDTLTKALKDSGFEKVNFAYDDRDFKSLENNNLIPDEQVSQIKRLMKEEMLGNMLLVKAIK